MKIAFFGVAPWEIEYTDKKVKEFLPGFEATYTESLLDKNHLPEDRSADVVSVFVNSIVDKDVIDAFPNLKFIATRSTGYDHVDLAYCKEKNIPVSYVPSYGENTVAEFAFALLLSLSRKTYEAYDKIREKGDYTFDGLQGFDLKGKTIAVIGTGRIGQHSIKIAKGFGMNVVAYDPFPKETLRSELGFEYLSLEDALKTADVVTLHVPYMEATHHLINENTLALMKKTAVLINTSRGPVVDTQALVKALKSGQLGGVGLDVLEEEIVTKNEVDFFMTGKVEGHDWKTVIANHLLVDMPNVIITPHNAFNTREALQRIIDTTISNMVGFSKGELVNLIER